jgi:NAD(P)H-hydrate epimerase
VYVASDSDWTHHRLSATDADLLIDALFGTGLTRPLAGLAAAIVADLNDAPVPVVSIDLPSGLSADRTDVPGPVVQADLTITFGAPKLPLAVTPACAYAGALVVADIGISPRVIEALPGPRVDWLEPEALRPLVRKRHVDSHKGQYGHVLVIGGSRGKIGAAGLAGMAALRAGAGLGTIAEDALPAVLKFDADVIALGPGLGRSPSTTAFVRGLVEQCRLPLVIDADALNAIAGHVDLLEAHVSSDVVITPHPGEMARLAGTTIERVQSDRLGMALTFAARHRAHVVLKGHRTVIATPAGRAFVNPTGNPGMATAGTGDVLTGVIAASLATGRSAVEAATLGAYLHGLAGDLAAARDGETGLVASDVIAQLRLATRTLASEKDFGSPFFRGPAR